MCLGLALEGACCAGREFCGIACSCFKCCCKMTMSQQIRLSYVLLNATLFAFTILVLHYLRDLFSYFADYLHCPESSGGKSQCLGSSSVYRMSFALLILYLIILIAVFARNECSKLFNEGIWCLKITGVLGIFVGFMFVSDEVFNGYRLFAQLFSGGYLFFQTVILIDIFYLWGQHWKGKYDEVEQQIIENNTQQVNYYGFLLIGVSGILYLATLVLNIYNFIWFKECGFNVFVNVLNIILIVAVTAVQVLGYNPSGSLLTSGCMSFYFTFLSFSGQLSSESQCNQAVSSTGIFAIELVVGIVLLLVSLLYLTFVKKNNKFIVQTSSEQAEGEQQNQSDEEKDKAALVQNKQEKQDDDLEVYTQTNNYILFHIIMAVSSVYCAMLITNWGGSSLNNFTIYEPSKTSYWVKITFSWISALVYIWTLVAPSIFPDRDFS